MQAGINLLGAVSVEYGTSKPFTAASPQHDLDRVVIRVDLNGRMLERLFTGVPLS